MHKTTVILREMSADEQIREEARRREKRLHDEAIALNHARKEGIAEGIAEGEARGRESFNCRDYEKERIYRRTDKTCFRRKL